MDPNNSMKHNCEKQEPTSRITKLPTVFPTWNNCVIDSSNVKNHLPSDKPQAGAGVNIQVSGSNTTVAASAQQIQLSSPYATQIEPSQAYHPCDPQASTSHHYPSPQFPQPPYHMQSGSPETHSLHVNFRFSPLGAPLPQYWQPAPPSSTTGQSVTFYPPSQPYTCTSPYYFSQLSSDGQALPAYSCPSLYPQAYAPPPPQHVTAPPPNCKSGATPLPPFILEPADIPLPPLPPEPVAIPFPPEPSGMSLLPEAVAMSLCLKIEDIPLPAVATSFPPGPPEEHHTLLSPFVANSHAGQNESPGHYTPPISTTSSTKSLENNYFNPHNMEGDEENFTLTTLNPVVLPSVPLDDLSDEEEEEPLVDPQDSNYFSELDSALMPPPPLPPPEKKFLKSKMPSTQQKVIQPSSKKEEKLKLLRALKQRFNKKPGLPMSVAADLGNLNIKIKMKRKQSRSSDNADSKSTKPSVSAEITNSSNDAQSKNHSNLEGTSSESREKPSYSKSKSSNSTKSSSKYSSKSHGSSTKSKECSSSKPKQGNTSHDSSSHHKTIKLPEYSSTSKSSNKPSKSKETSAKSSNKPSKFKETSAKPNKSHSDSNTSKTCKNGNSESSKTRSKSNGDSNTSKTCSNKSNGNSKSSKTCSKSNSHSKSSSKLQKVSEKINQEQPKPKDCLNKESSNVKPNDKSSLRKRRPSGGSDDNVSPKKLKVEQKSKSSCRGERKQCKIAACGEQCKAMLARDNPRVAPASTNFSFSKYMESISRSKSKPTKSQKKQQIKVEPKPKETSNKEMVSKQKDEMKEEEQTEGHTLFYVPRSQSKIASQSLGDAASDSSNVPLSSLYEWTENPPSPPSSDEEASSEEELSNPSSGEDTDEVKPAESYLSFSEKTWEVDNIRLSGLRECVENQECKHKVLKREERKEKKKKHESHKEKLKNYEQKREKWSRKKRKRLGKSESEEELSLHIEERSNAYFLYQSDLQQLQAEIAIEHDSYKLLKVEQKYPLLYVYPTPNIDLEELQQVMPTSWRSHYETKPYYKGYVLRGLSKNSEEYNYVKKKFHSTLDKKILAIDKLENPFMWARYCLKRDQLIDNKEKCDEVHVFHGTNRRNLRSLLRQNFDYKRHGAKIGNRYGCGVSFARDASYSLRYTDKFGLYLPRKNIMLMVRTTDTKKMLGGYQTVTLPEGYHASVDEEENVFVKYRDDEFYPEYVIHFDRYKTAMPSRNWYRKPKSGVTYTNLVTALLRRKLRAKRKAARRKQRALEKLQDPVGFMIRERERKLERQERKWRRRGRGQRSGWRGAWRGAEGGSRYAPPQQRAQQHNRPGRQDYPHRGRGQGFRGRGNWQNYRGCDQSSTRQANWQQYDCRTDSYGNYPNNQEVYGVQRNYHCAPQASNFQHHSQAYNSQNTTQVHNFQTTSQSYYDAQAYNMDFPCTYQSYNMDFPTTSQTYNMNYPSTSQTYNMNYPSTSQPYNMNYPSTSQSYNMNFPTTSEAFNVHNTNEALNFQSSRQDFGGRTPLLPTPYWASNRQRDGRGSSYQRRPRRGGIDETRVKPANHRNFHSRQW